ncbi:hypothetical protein C1924_04810 [Stenotrophomonas sp. ESTM1D_MKCIP4_1]|uniref:Lnb N-terminal periplasmic domain-containing protein n=1 Tax=Stenotrophomonas sp. ESTM1D_MKCIP4_1 TaxID=2072414 RepID=UPI000D53FC38|nr:DUF4105 domain-containing protein [Stenotrophomonas sp. ESTM1D_MKCIP4_1]AWH52537.1 hypothetical protein C1924_04810 [Stenotrophomonas sp. ESTM1D_MKCIP4_1]
MALLALWVAGMFAYQLPGPGWLSGSVAVLWLLAALYAAVAVARGRISRRWTGFYLGSVALAGLWWLLLTPRQDRDWADDVAQRLHVESFDGRHVVLDNVRDFTWRSETDYDARWVRREYDLDQLRSADLALSYWMGPAIAHTLVSFGFDDGRHLVFSLEIRKERGESFSALGGFFRRFEMTLVASEETDILRTRTNTRGEDVYLYRLHGLDRGQLKALFAAYLDEARQLDAAPAFYNTATSNCTTIVFDLARHIAPGLPLDYRLLLSGYLAEYAQEVGALAPDVPYAELHAKGRITERALQMAPGEDYSTVIRRGIPGTGQDPQP